MPGLLSAWLLAVALADAWTRRLPNGLMALGALGAAAAWLDGAALAGLGGPSGPGQALAWGLGALVLAWPGQVWGRLGGGDVKLLAVLGLWLGPLLLPVLLLALLSQGVHALVLVWAGSPAARARRLPLGSHLGGCGLLVLAGLAP